MKKQILFALAATAVANPANAEVKSQNDMGFVSSHSAEVLAKPEEVWKRLIAPKEWWSPSHSWSGKVDGFYIEPKAGGCFCELIQEKGADGATKTRGSVEHMRVIYADPGKVLRMQGALGPLQSEAVLGTFTVAMEPLKNGAGTKLSFNYAVGGYTRVTMTKMGAPVDAVLAEQFASLIKPLGKVVASDVKADDWKLDLEKLEEKKPDVAKPAAKKPDEKAPSAPAKPNPKAAPPKPEAGTPDKSDADSMKDDR
jgi:hypothetical protein